jgi:hypothetical protein
MKSSAECIWHKADYVSRVLAAMANLPLRIESVLTGIYNLRRRTLDLVCGWILAFWCSMLGIQCRGYPRLKTETPLLARTDCSCMDKAT